MKPDLVSPDFLFTFGFTFGKHTGNNSTGISEIAISNLFRKSNISIKSALILRTTNTVLELVAICYQGLFCPRYTIVIVKRDECRNRVNI